VTGWFVVLHYQPSVPGAVFVASFAAYTLCRQGILRLRVEPRKSSVGGPVTAGVAAIVLIAAVAASVI
jgi:hypothetical protein